MKIAVMFLAFIVFLIGCHMQQPPASHNIAPQPDSPSAQATASVEEPVHETTPQKLREAWRDFTKDGKYRMAQRREVAGMPYHYGWKKDVLVIVVDQSHADESIFRLAYFEPPDVDGGNYRLRWVEHNFELSKCRVSNASSDLVLYEGGDPARRAAFLRWDKKRQEYICWAR